MAGQCCDNCVYSVFDPQVWRRALWTREPILPRCANHPQWPGRLHDVPGVACRNYRPKPVPPHGDDVRLIPLGDGFYAYVDAADYDWLSRYTWHLHGGYAARHEKGKRIFMHREIMQAPEGMVVDHFDTNRVNNCRINLHVCTPADNQRNKRKRRGSRSRFIGVSYDKRSRKWSAKYWFAGKQYWLGSFDDEVEAARAYDRKAVELFGEFARLNFPEEWPPQRRQEVYAQSPHPAESSSTRTRRGESSFARPSATPQRAKGKKAETKEGKPAAAKPRATKRSRQKAPKTPGHKRAKRAT